jgi:hypothetical protein
MVHKMAYLNSSSCCFLALFFIVHYTSFHSHEQLAAPQSLLSRPALSQSLFSSDFNSVLYCFNCLYIFPIQNYNPLFFREELPSSFLIPAKWHSQHAPLCLLASWPWPTPTVSCKPHSHTALAPLSKTGPWPQPPFHARKVKSPSLVARQQHGLADQPSPSSSLLRPLMVEGKLFPL